MHTRIRDTTDQLAPEWLTWHNRGLRTRWRGIRQIYGTFCFTVYDVEQGCGDPLQVEITQGQQLSGSFGIKGLSVSATVTSSVSQTLTHQTAPCETCLGVACFREATLRQYGFRSSILRDYWEEERFLPGKRLLLTEDCQPEPECDGCSHPDSDMDQRSLPSAIEGGAEPCAYVRTVSYEGPDTSQISSEEDQIDEAQEIIDRLGMSSSDDPYGSDTAEIVIAQPQENISLTSNDWPRLALLSFDMRDSLLGGFRMRDETRIPVLAVAPALSNPRATIRLYRLTSSEASRGKVSSISRSFPESELLFEDALVTRTSRFTAILGEISTSSAGYIPPDADLAFSIGLEDDNERVDEIFVRIAHQIEAVDQESASLSSELVR